MPVVVQLLQDNSLAAAIINLQREKGITAAHEGHLAIVTELLKVHGCRKDVQDIYGDTALSLAARKGHVQVVEHLEKAAAADASFCSNG